MASALLSNPRTMNPENPDTFANLLYAVSVLGVELGLIHDWLAETFETTVLNKESVHYKNVHRSTDEVKMIKKSLDKVVKAMKNDDHVRRQLFPNEVETSDNDSVQDSPKFDLPAAAAVLNEVENSMELEPFSSNSGSIESGERPSPIPDSNGSEEAEEESQDETSIAPNVTTNDDETGDNNSSLTDSNEEENESIRVDLLAHAGRTPCAKKGATRIEIRTSVSNSRQPEPSTTTTSTGSSGYPGQISELRQDFAESSPEIQLEPLERIPVRVNQKTGRKRLLERVTSQENDKLLHKCQFCEKAFAQKGNKNTHERIHTGERPFKCQFCNRRFTNQYSKIRHERVHTRDRPYECKYCKSRLTQLNSKINHERIHTCEKPFKCQFCDNRFTEKGHKIRHERIHTGDKPYKCQHCPAVFAHWSVKTRHERVHTGVKPFACGFCNKRFTQMSNQGHHLRIHTGEKPYRCQPCDKSFTQMASLQSHERSKAHLSRLNQ